MKKIIWKKIWARKFSPFMADVYSCPIIRGGKVDIYRPKLIIPEDRMFSFYFSANEWNKFVKNFSKYILKQNIKVYGRYYQKIFFDSVVWAKKFVKTDFSKLTNDKLIIIYKELLNFYYNYGQAQYPAFIASDILGVDLEKRLADYPNKSEIMNWITTPYKITLIVKSHLELLQLLIKERWGSVFLKDYVNKYKWITKYDIVQNDYTMADLRKEIELIKNPAKEIKNFYTERKKALSKYQRFLRTLRDKKIKKLIETVHYFAYLKEMRDDYRRQVVYILTPLWKELGNRLGINHLDVGYCIGDEIIDLLRQGKRVDKKVIVARKNIYSLVVENGKASIVTKDLSVEYLGRSKRINISESSGKSAYVGKVRGTAKIILHRDEFKKFKQGEILITVMTHPEFLPLIKIARAIVTDEGGITCHAAIVARELRKPCIIGTKFATKVFKDGDIVEVDADKGIIKKVK